MCEACGGLRFAFCADLGGALLLRCTACGKATLRRRQQPRGRWLHGDLDEMVVSAAGEIG